MSNKHFMVQNKHYNYTKYLYKEAYGAYSPSIYEHLPVYIAQFSTITLSDNLMFCITETFTK